MDPTRNNVVVTLTAGIDASVTSMQLLLGQGALLPNPATEGAFNMAVYNSTDYSNPSDDPNLEYVRVTAIAADVLTITRAQEGSTAKTHNTAAKTYKAAIVWTKKSIDEIPFVLEGVLVGATSQCQINDVRLTVNSRGFPATQLNAGSNMVQGQLNIVEHGNGYLIVESTGAEINDKNIVVMIYKR